MDGCEAFSHSFELKLLSSAQILSEALLLPNLQVYYNGFMIRGELTLNFKNLLLWNICHSFCDVL